MRHEPVPPRLFTENRERLAARLPHDALAVVQANDVLPTNADGSLPLVANSDLFYLSGIEQEQSILVIAPGASDPRNREILFIRESNPHLRTWEGYKHSREDAKALSGIATVRWLSEFPNVFRQLMTELQQVFLNTNEHNRANPELETRDIRFIQTTQRNYPLHTYRRLAPLMHELRAVKSPLEVDLIRRACAITREGFLRVLKKTRPGVTEYELEAEFAHAFIRRRARFAYNPIIASGRNSCVLHYNQNDAVCRSGDVLLLDVAASYANYNADLTRTIPVNGKFTRRQRAVYDAVLRVLRSSIHNAKAGTLPVEWLRKARAEMNDELLRLGLIKTSDVRKETPQSPACFRYFMHGLGHPLGLDVHDVHPPNRPFAPGWVLTVEPGIYIEDEGFGVRLENDILVTDGEAIDLMADIPIEADDIEDRMRR